MRHCFLKTTRPSAEQSPVQQVQLPSFAFSMIEGRVAGGSAIAAMGWMIVATASLVAVLVLSLAQADRLVPSSWDLSISDTLYGAELRSTLVTQLGLGSSFHFWFDLLRMVELVCLFTGITLAMTVIVKALWIQVKLLPAYYYSATSG